MPTDPVTPREAMSGRAGAGIVVASWPIRRLPRPADRPTGRARGRAVGQALGRVLAGLVTLGTALLPAATLAAVACPVAEAPSAAASASAAATPAWRRARVVAGGDDLQVCADGRLLLSLRDESARALRQEFPGEWPFLAVAYEARVLSLLGPFLSVEERRVTENPATYLRERVRVYDLRSPGRVVTLDELFDDAALTSALLHHEPLRQAVGARALARAAAGTDSRGLAQRLAEATQVEREGKVFLPPGWLGGFWFDSRRGPRLEVGLALPVRSGMREETLSRSRLRLPVPTTPGHPLRGLPATPDEGLVPAGSPPPVARWSFTSRP